MGGDYTDLFISSIFHLLNRKRRQEKMKKLLLGAIIGLFITSCTGALVALETNPGDFQAKSELVLASVNDNVLLIKDNAIGHQLYETWLTGAWGHDHVVILMDTTYFNKIYEESYTSRSSN